MAELGIITGSQIRKNRDGTVDRIILQVESIPGDVRSVEYIGEHGLDSRPSRGCRAFVTDAANGYKAALAVTDDLTPEVGPGEKEFYSTDDPATTKLARLKLNSAGEIELNGDADNAIRYTEYDINIQSILTQINANLTLIQTAITGLGGSYVPVPVVEVTIPARVDEVKLP
jgi:hypothetical protein